MSQPRSSRPAAGSDAGASRLRSRAEALLGAVALAAGLLLGGCAQPPVVAEAPGGLFDDASVAPAVHPVDPDDALRLTPAMEAYLRERILPSVRNGDNRHALLEALYDHDRLRLEYEASTTRTAAQAFEARSGNCLALVMMTGAFAKAMGLDVTYQQVDIDESWTRSGSLYFMSGHVNLQLAHRASELHGRFERTRVFTVDFLPTAQAAHLRATAIPERTVVAMFMNNRAAEAIQEGQLDDAYWRARDAIRSDPSYMSAYNTLGVIYLRRHDPARAAAALRFALDRAPDNPLVLSNYAQALHGVGRDGEARELESRLARIEPYPPFYFFTRARLAYLGGRYAEARALLEKELAREPDYHEFHYWLALCDYQLGRLDEARAELTLALEDADRRSDHDLYAAKLDRLKAIQVKAVVQ